MADLGFDPQQYDPPGEFSPIPAGDYVAKIIESAKKPTKARTGEFLEFKFEVLQGEYKGRNVWGRINIMNPNPQAQEIGRGEVRALCDACGIPSPRDTAQLHGLPISIRVALERRTDKPDTMSNVIKSYKPIQRGVQNAQTPPAGTQTTGPAQAAQYVNTGPDPGAAPWGG